VRTVPGEQERDGLRERNFVSILEDGVEVDRRGDGVFRHSWCLAFISSIQSDLTGWTPSAPCTKLNSVHPLNLVARRSRCFSKMEPEYLQVRRSEWVVQTSECQFLTPTGAFVGVSCSTYRLSHVTAAAKPFCSAVQNERRRISDLDATVITHGL